MSKQTVSNKVLISDAVLYVTQDDQRIPEVSNYISRLKKLGSFNEKKVISVSEFAELKKLNQKQSKNAESKTILEAENLFRSAAQRDASDIHIRVTKGFARVLFRKNGSLFLYKEMEEQNAKALCSTIYTSMVDVSAPTYQSNAYQNARVDPKKLPEGVNGIRIATAPQVDGNIMVMRLIYDGNKKITGTCSQRLDALGFSSNHLKTIDFIRRRPTGINIVAGPTGSGKSTSLKHVLEAISSERPDLHILTVEDPPEYPINNVVQMPVIEGEDSEKRKVAFGDAIRAAMRLDPDIIMIGEIRDRDSAKLALSAAMTGHQVWTTLHANSAFNILNRFSDLMLAVEEPEPLKKLADITVLSGLIFQRLVKKLCPHCKISFLENKEMLNPGTASRLASVVDLYKEKNIFIKGKGCEHCDFTGVSGRTVLSEIVSPDPSMIDFLRRNDVDGARRYWLSQQEGETVVMHAIDKIKEGYIDPSMAEEVIGPLTIDAALEDGVLQKGEIHELSL